MTEPQVDSAAFPELDDRQLAVMFEHGQRRTVSAGEVLFSPDDARYDFIVILSGAVEILGTDGGHEVVIARHTARRFLGEVSLLPRQHPYLTARVAEGGDVLVVSADDFLSRVLSDVRVSDVI